MTTNVISDIYLYTYVCLHFDFECMRHAQKPARQANKTETRRKQSNQHFSSGMIESESQRKRARKTRTPVQKE